MKFCETNYWQLINRIRRAINLSEQSNLPFCNLHNITPLQLNILCTIYFGGPQTISDLAQHNCIARGNNSVLCKKLEKEGFLLRQRDIADERQVLVKLTPRSKQIVQEYIQNNKQNQQKLSAKFSDKELREFVQNIDLVITIIEEKMGDTQ